MAAKDVVFSNDAASVAATGRDRPGAPSNGSIVPVAAGDPRAWRQRLRRARNILSLVLLAAVFSWRSAVSWRRWRRRHPER